MIYHLASFEKSKMIRFSSIFIDAKKLAISCLKIWERVCIHCKPWSFGLIMTRRIVEYRKMKSLVLGDESCSTDWTFRIITPKQFRNQNRKTSNNRSSMRNKIWLRKLHFIFCDSGGFCANYYALILLSC